MKVYWDPKEQSTKRHPVNIRFPKRLVQHIGEVRSCLNRNKTSVPVFYRGNKTSVLVLVRIMLAHSRFNSYAPELVPMFYYRDKTRVQMFFVFLIHPHTHSYIVIMSHIITIKVALSLPINKFHKTIF